MTKTPISVKDALTRIRENTNRAFIWFCVRNNTGCLFEIGGTNKSMIARIPKYNSIGEPETRDNGTVINRTSLCTGDDWIHPNDGLNVSQRNFLKLIKKDFRLAKIEPGYSYYEEILHEKPPKITFEK